MKNLIFVLILCFANTTLAQIKFQGVVKDSVGSALELASIIAMNQKTNALESFTITNDIGFFSLTLGKNSRYKLQISYVGMKTFEGVITTSETDTTRDFILKSDNVLDVVELIYEIPVNVEGDTIVFNADSFKNGSERKLEDVLEKLPGVEINEEGQVEFEGKELVEVIKNNMTHKDKKFPIADKEWLKLITLPVHPAMTEEDIDYVIYWVNKYFENEI